MEKPLRSLSEHDRTDPLYLFVCVRVWGRCMGTDFCSTSLISTRISSLSSGLKVRLNQVFQEIYLCETTIRGGGLPFSLPLVGRETL